MENQAKKYVSTKEMTREQWLAGRSKYIGASETAAALGLDRYKTPYDLWLQKTTGEKAEMTDIGAQRAAAGLRAENMISEWLAEKYSITIRRDNKIRIHPRLPFWSANLDRVIVNHPSGPGVLELKTTSRESLKSWSITSDEPSPIFMHHWVQVQAQMAITGYEWGAIGVMPADSFLGFGEPDLIEIERDNDFIQMMETEIEEFWTKHVATNTPPPPKTVDDVRALYPIAGPPPLEVGEDVYEQVRLLKQLKDRISCMEVEEKTISDQLKIMIGNHDAAIYGGKEIFTYKNSMTTVFDDSLFEKDYKSEAEQCKKIDKKAVEQNYPDIYKRYITKEPGARVLRLKTKEL